MTILSALNKACTVFLVCSAMAIAAPAQTFTTLVSFDGTDVADPVAAPVQGTDGKLHGTTEGGGAGSNSVCYEPNCGTVFEVAISSKLTSLYSFCAQPNCADGGTPYTGLVQASDQNFYGTTVTGGDLTQNCLDGCGTIFKMTPKGTLTTLHQFCSQPYCYDGGQPFGVPIQGTDGSIYGTTFEGGTSGNGTIFRMTRTGVLTTLHSFAGRPTEGEGPRGALVQATDGNFYGTTDQGGASNSGTVFRMTPTGTLTTLYSFCAQSNCTDGEFPDAGLVQAADGNFYGTTSYGGTVLNCSGYGDGCGTVFRITPSGTLTTLHSFGKSDGSYPYTGMIQGTDGNLYGATSEGGNLTCFPNYGCGTLFQITLDGTLTNLHNFDVTDGSGPVGLIQATNGMLYGATGGGGNSCSPYGCGTVFSLDMGLGPFVTFLSAAGKVGQTGGILGQGLTGTTSVALNGIPATFTVKSDTLIEATVPAGATTGYVTVTTPSGTLTSNVPFHVIK